MDVPSDEDTLIFYVISSFTTEKEKLQALLDNQYASKAYPDKAIVENGVKLCNELSLRRKITWRCSKADCHGGRLPRS